MSSPASQASLFLLHAAVLLFAFAGLFAKWLSLDAYWLVLARTIFAAIVLFCLLVVRQPTALKLSKTATYLLVFSGLLLFIHWLTFFYAIQLSTVAFALLTFSSFPLFTLLLEWMLSKQIPSLPTALQGCVILLGIWILVSGQDLAIQSMSIIMGLLSALTFAGLLLVNKRLTSRCPAMVIAAYQNGFAALWALPFCSFFTISMAELYQQLPMLLILGVVFTAFAHSLLNSALSALSAFKVSIAICLEPVYGTLAAILFLGEQLSTTMLLGGGLILAVNIYQARSKNN